MKNTLRKLGLLVTMITALLFITGCPSPNTGSSGLEVTIYTYEGSSTIVKKTFKVEGGDSLSTITDLKAPDYGDDAYEFLGYYTKNGTKFPETLPIQTSLELYAKVQKKTKAGDATIQDGTITNEYEIKTADQTTGEKTEIITVVNGEKTGTSETITTKDDTTNQPVSSVTTSTQTDENGTTTTTTQTTNYDSEGNVESTVKDTTIVDTEGNTTTSTTTTTTDSNGNPVSTTNTTIVDSEGNGTTTTQTTTVDESGNTVTNTEVEVSGELSVHEMIEQGISLLEQGNVDAAQTIFNNAYKKYPNDNEAKVYSALADLTSIATNSKIQKFFSDHLGVTNYPSTVNALISGAWLTEGTYKIEEEANFMAYDLVPVTGSIDHKEIYYKVSIVEDKIEWHLDEDINDYVLMRQEQDGSWVPAEGVIRASARTFNWEKVSVDDKDYWVDPYDAYTINENFEGITHPFWGRNISGIYGYSSSGSSSYYGYVTPDEKGKYWAQLPADKAGDATPYEVTSEWIKYKYPVTVLAPKLKDLKDEEWFTTKIDSTQALSMLIVANIVNGNSMGLDSAIDDIYSALFESPEYESAISKINSINGPVALPSEVVEGLNLQAMFGEEQSVQVGATELKLIKSALDVVKGVFEYFQTYSFSTDLSFLKTDYSIFVEDKYKGMPEEFYDWGKDNFGAYKASVDPIGNGFLSVRAPEKMEAAKATFAGVITDIIAAYDSVTGKDSIYPDEITKNAKKVAVLRDAALALKAAITEGGKFYIPMDIVEVEPEAWPTKAGANIMEIDCGKLFKAGQFAIDNLIELGEVEGAKADTVPLFYGIDDKGDLVQITTAEEFMALFTGSEEGEDEGDDEEYNDKKEDPYVYLKFLLPTAASEIVELPQLAEMPPYLPLPVNFGAFIFNFYYGGFEDKIEALLWQPEPTNKPEATGDNGGNQSGLMETTS